jgi:hypothetical protein
MMNVLGILLQYIPALIEVIYDAVGGSTHRHEESWCDHIEGLKDVCEALRDGDEEALKVVRGILGDIGTPSDQLAIGLSQLRRGR